MSYPPNHQGIRWFADEVWPRVRSALPDARLDVVGKDPPEAVRALDGRDGVAVHGFVPSMAPFFAAAHAVVVPILTGAGIRVKIVEAMSAGRALVSTSLGWEGLAHLEPGRHLLVADEPAAFADAALRLLGDEALRTRMAADAARAGRARVRLARRSATGSRPCSGPPRDPRRPEPRLHGPGPDGRDGGRRPRADPGAARRRARAPLHGVRQPRGGRARTSASTPSSCPWTRRAASSGCAASRRCCPAWRAAPAATSCTRSARRRRRAAAFARVTTIHDLNYLMVPDAHFGVRGLGMRVLVPLAARTRAPRDRRLGARRATTSSRGSACRRPASTSSRSASAGRPRREPTPAAELRAALGLGDRPVVLSLSAKRPHKNLRGLLDALARIAPERRPVLVLPGYATPHEEELRRTPPASGVTADVRFLGWTRPRTSRACSRSPGRSCSRRSTRASACRCSRRWRAACRSRARTGRRCPRWRATPRCSSTRTTRRRSPPRSSGCWPIARESRPAAGGGPRAGRAVHVGARGRADARRLRAGAVGAVAGRDGVERGVDRQRGARCARTRPPCEARRPAPASCTRRIAAASASGSALSATKPLTPSSTSSVAALSGSRTSTTGVPDRGGLDDDEPVALAARRAARGRAPAPGRARPPRRARSRAPRRRPRARAPRSRRAPRRGRVRRRRSAPRSSGSRSRARATAGTTAGARFSGIMRPAKTTSGSAGSGAGSGERAGVEPAQHLHVPAQPGRADAARGAARRSRTRAGARAGTAPGPPARSGPRRRRGSRASTWRSRARTSRRRAGSGAAGAPRRRRAARSTGTSGVHDVVAAAVAQQVGEHARAEHERRQDAALPALAVEAEPRARRDHAHAGDLPALAARPLAQREVGHLVPVGGEALREVAIPALRAADRVGEQAVVDEADPHRARLP